LTIFLPESGLKRMEGLRRLDELRRHKFSGEDFFCLMLYGVFLSEDMTAWVA
jgi:hypothetical protein